ncbi:hypothetical protein CFIMG_006007RA [Ceratocystis fimbriata CBS 114723]|uniref:Uncharacterized protein n=1 Tax=Ceratocystis fimbriata CBS 114723 TaxID=1035309 RepID=A0A2C5WXS6_9PEZI|nr:hypothetical protein CFIMG_006007RA [Ceratocystis fimbriata CBS 114723]
MEDHNSRSLKHLLRANHSNYACLFGAEMKLQNPLGPLLCSAYAMGANNVQLHALYDEYAKILGPWEDSPSEMIDEDWQDFYGNPKYQRATVDYFEDALVMTFNYDWRKLVGTFLFQGPKPLFNGLMSGLGNPLVHLANSLQINSKELSMEAFALSSAEYDYTAEYMNSKFYAEPSSRSSGSIKDLLDQVRQDDRFDQVFSEPSPDKIPQLFQEHEALMMEYWNAWILDDLTKQFRESQEVAVALLVSSVKRKSKSHSKALAQVLAASHAIRIILQFIPKESHIKLVRSWWLMTLAAYVSNLRPEIDTNYADVGEIKGRQWSYVENMALESPWFQDASYVNSLRSMRDIAETWKDADEKILLAAVIFADEFGGWKP